MCVHRFTVCGDMGVCIWRHACRGQETTQASATLSSDARSLTNLELSQQLASEHLRSTGVTMRATELSSYTFSSIWGFALKSSQAFYQLSTFSAQYIVSEHMMTKLIQYQMHKDSGVVVLPNFCVGFVLNTSSLHCTVVIPPNANRHT